MAEQDLRQATTTDLTNADIDYDVKHQALDSPSDSQETTWTNTDFDKWMGYYKKIPELNQSIKALAFWSFGKGVEVEVPQAKVEIENITGWGEDSFQDIMENMLRMKKVAGDAFAEIVRNEEKQVINLKPLNPKNVEIVVDKKGLIKHYNMLNKQGKRTGVILQPENMFHISNDRMGDEIHGESVVGVAEWVILARNEAMADWKRISHRSTVRIIYADTDNTTTLNTLKEQWKDGIKNGEVVIIPGLKKDMEVEQQSLPNIAPFIEWIRYLEGFFYQAVGVPRIIATSEGFTEAGGKVGFLTFEPVYTNEQRKMEADLLNQLGWKVTFNRPPSLQENVQQDEQKNAGQTGFQPNDVQAGVGE